jgi:hypothetical protein
VLRNPAFVALVASTAACTPFGVVDGPGDAALTVDGSSAATDGGDAARPDGSPPSTLRCKSPPPGTLFCEDFESDKPKLGFTDSYGDGAFTAERIAVAGRGMVLAYHATISASSPNGWLRFGPNGVDADMSFAELELTADVAIVSQAFDGGIVAALWTLSTDAAPAVHGIASGNQGTFLDASEPRTDTKVKNIAPAEWHTITVLLQRGGATFTRVASVDGDVVESGVVPVTPSFGWDARIGVFYGTYGNAEVLFDDVIVIRK